MRGFLFNTMKSLEKSTTLVGLILCGNLHSGCANSPQIKRTTEESAAYEGQCRGQKAWVDHDHTASASYHFAMAQAYSMEGKVEQAIEEYRAALIYDSKAAVIYTKLAQEYIRKGETSLAMNACESALKIDSRSIEAHLMLGGIYSVQSQPLQAIREYDEVLKLDPRNDEAAVFKTQTLVELEKMDEALSFIKKFISKVNDSAAAWFYAGKLEQMKGLVNAAVADYRKALDLRPGFSQATLSLGIILEGIGQDEKAKEVYQEQLELKQDIHIASRLASIYLKKGEFEDALKVLTILAVLDPEDMNTQLKIGLVYLQNKDWVNAEKTFFSILDKVPDSDKAHYYLGAALEEMGKTNEAIFQLGQISSDSKFFEEANIHIVLHYKKQKDFDHAHEALQAALKKAPETSGFYILKASLFEEKQELKRAGDALADGLKFFPENEKMLYFYGSILDKQAKQDEAIEQMQKILKINPRHAEALNYIAYTWTSQGVRLQDAEEMLKMALKIKPNSPFILDSMGWNQFRLGRKAAALRYLEKAVSLKEDEQTILEHLMEVYSGNQMPERAQATKIKIQKLNSGSESRAPASIDP
jgi:tetratricopeptide (TPR) repeat protein